VVVEPTELAETRVKLGGNQITLILQLALKVKVLLEVVTDVAEVAAGMMEAPVVVVMLHQEVINQVRVVATGLQQELVFPPQRQLDL
jgi:hypothetical protein